MSYRALLEKSQSPRVNVYVRPLSVHVCATPQPTMSKVIAGSLAQPPIASVEELHSPVSDHSTSVSAFTTPPQLLATTSKASCLCRSQVFPPPLTLVALVSHSSVSNVECSADLLCGESLCLRRITEVEIQNIGSCSSVSGCPGWQESCAQRQAIVRQAQNFFCAAELSVSEHVQNTDGEESRRVCLCTLRQACVLVPGLAWCSARRTRSPPARAPPCPSEDPACPRLALTPPTPRRPRRTSQARTPHLPVRSLPLVPHANREIGRGISCLHGLRSMGAASNTSARLSIRIAHDGSLPAHLRRGTCCCDRRTPLLECIQIVQHPPTCVFLDFVWDHVSGTSLDPKVCFAISQLRLLPHPRRAPPPRPRPRRAPPPRPRPRPRPPRTTR